MQSTSWTIVALIAVSGIVITEGHDLKVMANKLNVKANEKISVTLGSHTLQATVGLATLDNNDHPTQITTSVTVGVSLTQPIIIKLSQSKVEFNPQPVSMDSFWTSAAKGVAADARAQTWKENALKVVIGKMAQHMEVAVADIKINYPA